MAPEIEAVELFNGTHICGYPTMLNSEGQTFCAACEVIVPA